MSGVDTGAGAPRVAQRTTDNTEAMAAFPEKRIPEFTGK